MTITFRCEHCHKSVQAPDTAGGKRGKCPYCKQSSYIPAPVSEEEVLDLAPIDEAEEQRQREEARKLLDQERALLAETGDVPEPTLEQKDSLTSEDLHHMVVNFCLDISGGQLERADDTVRKLSQFQDVSIAAVDDFLTERAIEPALADIPPRVLQGLLKQLRDRLTRAG